MEVKDVLDLLWWRTTLKGGQFQERNSLDDSPSGAPLLLELLKDQVDLALGVDIEDMVVTHLPIPPLTDRQGIQVHEGISRRPGMDIYLSLMQANQFLLRNSGEVYSDLDTIWAQRMEEVTHQRLQDWFEKLWYSCHPETGGSRWEAERQAIILRFQENSELLPDVYDPDPPDMITPEMVQETWMEDASDKFALQRVIPLAILEVQDQLLWLQYVDRGELRDPGNGRIVYTLDTKGELIGLAGEDHLLAFHFLEQVLVFDLQSRSWREHYGGMELVYMEELTPEKAYLVDIGRQQTLRCEEVIDYPMPPIRTRDGRFIWIEDKEASGGIYDTRSGWIIFNPGDLDSIESMYFLDREGKMQELSEAAWDILEETLSDKIETYRQAEIEANFQQNALGLKDGKWWSFLGNALWINGDAIWRTDMPVTAAAFNGDTTRLYLANKDEMILITLNPDGTAARVQSHSLI